MTASFVAATSRSLLSVPTFQACSAAVEEGAGELPWAVEAIVAAAAAAASEAVAVEEEATVALRCTPLAEAIAEVFAVVGAVDTPLIEVLR